MAKKINGKRGPKRAYVPTRPRTREYSLGVALAIKASGGSLTHLADAVGISAQAISAWQEVPLNRVLLVEKVTGVSRKKLRPDLFG